MADNFNKFFASIAEKIVEQIHPVNVFFYNVFGDHLGLYYHSFYIR